MSIEEETPRQDMKQRKHGRSILHRHRISLRIQDRHGRGYPKLAFRWYDRDSQGLNTAHLIRAGLYADPKVQIPPPLQGKAYESACLSHLTPEKRLSPLISVFESFLPAIHRGLRGGQDACIAVIDLQAVVEGLHSRYKDAEGGAEPIKVIIKRYGFNLRNNYAGKEWLIHGLIEKEAIIQTVRVSDLNSLAQMQVIPGMSDVLSVIKEQVHASGISDLLLPYATPTGYASGLSVGRILDEVRIPDSHKALVAAKIKNMLGFPGYKNRGPVLRAYLRGVYGLPEDSDVLRVVGWQGRSPNTIGPDLADFVNASDDDYDSNESYRDDSEGETQDLDEEDTVSDTTKVSDEQALVDAQLHAEENAWLDELLGSRSSSYSPAVGDSTFSPPSSTERAQRFSHVEIPKPKGCTQDHTIIDLTLDEEDTDGIQSDGDVIIVDVCKRKAALPVRSASASTGPRGLARLEADVLEMLQEQ